MTLLMKLRLETALRTSSSGNSRLGLEFAFSVIPGYLLPNASAIEVRGKKGTRDFYILAVGLAAIVSGFGNLRIAPGQRK
jgi:hypothetical protein